MGFKRGEVYPSWRATASGETQLVNNAAEDAALGPEWDVPEAFTAPAAVPDAVAADATKKRGRKPKDTTEA